MSSPNEEPFETSNTSNDSSSEPPLEITSGNGYEDVAASAFDLIKTPQALLNFFLDVQKARSVSSPFLVTLAFYLLAQLKLQRRIGASYLDRQYADAMLNSSVVNLTHEVLSSRYQERFDDLNPFSGFKEFFARRDISRSKSDRFVASLQCSPEDDSTYKVKVDIFHLTLELQLDDVPEINDTLPQKLPSCEQQRSNKQTEDLIVALGDYFARNDYAGINYQQLVVLAECIAYVKRFHRNLWRVEVEDVLESWFLINYCRHPRPPLTLTTKNVLNAIDSKNRAGIFPSQRQIIATTGIANNTVNHALGLKIKSREGVGKLILDGYVEYDYAEEGYRLTDLGKLVLTNDFHITVSDTTYHPKNPLE